MLRTVITKTKYEKTCAYLEDKFADLENDGSFFAFVSTEYDRKGNAVHDLFDIIEKAVSLGYQYINTIVYPTENVRYYSTADNVRYVVWFCKNRREVRFDKDVIREKHIWKDVEWGKRTKNYNPKGKDPGNVWIPTNDDGKAHITEHILLSDEEVKNRLLKMTECGNDFEIYWDETAAGEEKAFPSHNLGGKKAEPAEGIVYFKSSETMNELVSGEIKTAVTSPPYWNLKDYFKEGQIGQEEYEEYLRRMEIVWKNCFDKLSERGSLWININIRVHDGKVIPIPGDIVKMCKKIGFFYKGIIIWHKSSGIPTGDKNIVDRHEYVLIFSKYEDFNIISAQKKYCDYKNVAINGGSFWNINRKAGSVGKKFIHPAIYPNELTNRIIEITTERGETVLDPFLGSGTTMISSLTMGRNCVGYEYNEGFEELIKSRLENELEEGYRVSRRTIGQNCSESYLFCGM